MSQVDKRLIEILAKTVDELRALNDTDRDAIVRIGAGLEEALQLNSGSLPLLDDILGLCLEALQAVYLGNVPDTHKTVQSIVESLSMIRQCLALDEITDMARPFDMAYRVLAVALGKEISESDDTDDAETGEPENITQVTLDDIATRLIQIEPMDVNGLIWVRNALESVSKQENYPEKTQNLVTEAIQAINDFEKTDSSGGDEVIAKVGELIEAAVNAIDEPASKKVSSAPTKIEKPVSASLEESTNKPAPSPIVADNSGAEEEMLPQDADKDLLADFITECREYIEGAEAALLTLESEPEDAEAVNTVFRAFHTIKGTSAFLGLTRISEMAHRAESLLSRVRDGEIRCTGGYADLALRSVDTLKDLMQGVQDALGGEPMVLPVGYNELMTCLANPEENGISGESATAEAAPRVGDILVAEGAATREDVETAAAEQGEDPIGQALVRSDAAKLSDVAKAIRTQKKISSAESAVESSVRVRTERLDSLIETVGELVIAQSMVGQDETVIMGTHHELAKKVIHMSKIVRELQYLSMSMRMVPLKPTFQKMARLVRDVARKSGKAVEFVSEGEDTEIDRNMVDIVNDPLVHMVRNAVDHGVELQDVRLEAGKMPTGVVKLSAYHSGGNVIVELRDDGKGLDRDKIIEKAISKGLIESEKGMSDDEIFNLIFEPGFSTADKITDVSGRGVGMDVVKRGIEALRGRIDITSEAGKGTTFTMRLPLTMAVTDGMLVKVGDERFIIPTISIHKSFRPDADALSTVNGRGELVMLRGELMPIFRLHHLFNIEGAIDDPTKGLLVILDDRDRRCALLVDELLGQQHVVAKSLGDGLGKVQGISGGAILGDGRVGLILDVSEIASMARHDSDSASWKNALCTNAA
jgi:two-component system chemotaxis sensor kinase CheA